MLPLADGLPRIGEVHIDVRVLIFAALVAVATTLLVTWRRLFAWCAPGGPGRC